MNKQAKSHSIHAVAESNKSAPQKRTAEQISRNREIFRKRYEAVKAAGLLRMR